MAAIALFLVAVGALASLGIEDEPPGRASVDAGATAKARAGRTPAEQGGAQLPPTDEVARRVERIRGLTFKQRPRVELIAAKELEGELKRVEAQARGKLTGDARRRAEGLAAASQVLTLAAGVVPPEQVEASREGAALEGVLGLYLPETGRVYVVRELARKAPAEAEAVLAHELAHALEDQAFGGFEREPRPFADSAFARHALHEGSATLTEVMYRIEHQRARGPVDRVLAGVRRQTSDPKAPPGLNVLTAFPYADGGAFAAALHRRGGWRAVDRAHQDPPATTSAVLHPAAWPEDRHERPRFSVDEVLGDGWARLGRADMGEVDTLALLSAGLGPDAARTAAEGWEAGRFEAWARGRIPKDCELPCRRHTAAVVVWKTTDEAQQRELSAGVLAAVAKATRAREAGEGVLRAGDGAIAQVARGRVSALAFAPTAGTARRLAAVSLR